MRMIHAAALAGALALSGCIDVDMTATIEGADQATVNGHMIVQRQMLDMMGGGEAFCPADEGGTLTTTDTEARCDVMTSGSFAEVFEGEPGEPTPTATDLGDGTVRVVFPVGQMGADTEEMRNDPQMAQMMRPMLEGHSFTIRLAGAEIVSTNGEISEDGTSASYTFQLVDILNPEVQLPETFEAVIRY
ncbi:hypothetical protein [Pararhodobacter sp. CCB-MM2]|uniref:hypothetical protein n=1 Tax=Pararhodobacter sp. CCB-MM2 TaxID=1786003 RepID=UPI00083105E3|nr:hypothetical protein [Pararhodobacter sp. CCB-MM2]MCA2010337.1 hypothetical protein [Cereibacter sphaeroides]